MSTKRCSKCAEVKPLEEFRKDSRERDGRRAYCRQCARKADKKYRSKPDIKQRDAARAREYKNPRIFGKLNPDARAAHNRVNNAIRSGLIPRASVQSCAHCGNRATEYHHHNGYGPGHEFDIIPLCRSCHRIAHSA